MAWAIRAAVCSMRLDVLSPLLYCRVPARLLRRRSMEDQRRRHQLPDVTAHLSQLLSKACCQRIIHNLGRWLIQWVFPRWLGSESKAMRSCSMVLKPSLMTRLSTFFPKKTKHFHFHWVSSWCSQASVSAEPAGLRLSKNTASLQQTPHAKNVQLPESGVLLQVFLNDLRSMFCLALLEAWCFPISALKALGLLPKEARRLEWYGIATPNTKCWGNYPPLPNPLKILPANQNHFLKTYEFGNIIHFIHTVDGKNPCNHLGCPKCWWHPMVGHPSLGTYQVGAKWLPLVGWRYPASQKQSPKKKLHKLVGGWIDSKKISAKRLDLNNHLRCHLVVGQLTLSKTLPEWMCVCVSVYMGSFRSPSHWLLGVASIKELDDDTEADVLRKQECSSVPVPVALRLHATYYVRACVYLFIYTLLFTCKIIIRLAQKLLGMIHAIVEYWFQSRISLGGYHSF